MYLLKKKEVTIEVYPTVFSFNGLNPLTSGAKIALRNNKVDLSSVIRNLERVKKSHKVQEKEEPDIAKLNDLRESLQWREGYLKDLTEKLEIIEAWP